MADTIRLTIELKDGAAALAQLNQIDKASAKLDKNKISLRTDTKGLDTANKQITQLTNALAKKATAEARSAEASAKAAAAEAKVATAAARTQQQAEKTKTSETNLQIQREKTAQASIKAITSENNLATAEAKVQQQVEKTKAKETELEIQREKTARATQTAAQQNNLLGASMSAIAARVSAYALATAAVDGLISSFKEALSTIKEVDTELTSIQKVTGMSSSQAQALGDRAFSTASQYGINVTDYLESVSTFAKAGYDDLSESLAELATKTQLVGDTNAEVANQFLLSADAAWGFEGNVDSLSKVLDAANAVENNYATSIEKIAEGFPIVANVASMAGMSAEQTIASLGTITASTQQSGESAARALRALILNIMGDTTTEIEDGVTATTESIETVNDILNTYSKEAVEAARASGELVNPLEAIAGMSQAVKDGLMTNEDLTRLASSLGGKLRTNELLALIQNWDTTYSGMMQTIATSAGSADAEVSTMLTSWEAKTNILSNKWTEFVNNFTDTSLIKGGLDAVIGLFDILNSDMGQVAIQAGLLGTGVSKLASLLIKAAGGTSTLSAAFTALTSAGGGLQSALLALSGTGLGSFISMISGALPYVAALAAAVAAGYGISKLMDDGEVSLEDQQKAITDTTTSLNELQTEYDNLTSKSGALTAAEQARATLLQAQIVAIQQQLDEAEAKAFSTWQKTVGLAGTQIKTTSVGEYVFDEATSTADVDTLNNMAKAFDDLKVQYMNGKVSAEEYKSALAELITTNQDYYEQVENGLDLGEDITDSQKEGLELYQKIGDELVSLTEAEAAAAEGAQEADDAVNKISDDVTTLSDNLTGAKEALEAFNNATKEEHGDTASEMASAYQKALEAANAGYFGSNVLQSGADLLFSDEFKQRLNYNTQEYAAALQDQNGIFAQVFGQGGDEGANFINYMRSIAEAGKEGIAVYDDLGNAVMTFQENADGSLSFDYSSIQALSRETGLAEDVILSLLESTEIYSQAAHMSAEESAAFAASLGLVEGQTVSSKEGIAGIVQEIVAMPQYANASAEEIASLLQMLEVMGLVDLSNISGGLGAIIAEALGLDQSAAAVNEEFAKMSQASADGAIQQVNQLAGAASNAAASVQQTNDALNSMDTAKKVTIEYVDNGLSTADAREEKFASQSTTVTRNIKTTNTVNTVVSNSAQLSQLQAQLAAIKSKTVNVAARVSGGDQVQALASNINGVGSKTVTLRALVVGAQSVSSLKSDWDSIKTKTVTLTTVTKTQEAAVGTKDSPGGATLVNELGPEIIAANGKAWIAGGGEPTITDVPKHAVVLTAQQTEQALNGNSAALALLNGAIESRWAGTIPAGKWSGSTSKTGGSASSSTWSAGSYNKDTKATADEDLSTLEDELDDALKILDLQAQLAERQGDAASVLKFYAEAEDRINALIEKYKAAGYSDTSKEILTLINKGYSYADDRVSTGDDLWEDLLDSIDAAKKAIDTSNDLEEKRQEVEDAQKALATAQAQRTVRIYNKDTGQWEWIADAKEVEDAQKDLADAQKDYYDELLDSEIQRVEDAKGSDLEDVIIGEAINSMLNETPEKYQQAFADALKALYGVSDYTTGSKAESLFKTGDSHDTVYNFPGGITLTQKDAEKTTLADIAKQLKALGVT